MKSNILENMARETFKNFYLKKMASMLLAETIVAAKTRVNG